MQTSQANERAKKERTRVHGLESEQHLTFGLGKETFAIPISRIREVIQFEGLTEVPLTPPFVRGVLNLRGSVVPVIDLSVRFDRPLTQIGPRTCVVILEVPAAEAAVVLGVLVDHVNEVLGIGADDVEPAPSFGSSVRCDFVSGVAKVGRRFVIVLDVARVLSVEELASLSDAKKEDVAAS
jgi:purine-binding chemotaxis protein CheW